MVLPSKIFNFLLKSGEANLKVCQLIADRDIFQGGSLKKIW